MNIHFYLSEGYSSSDFVEPFDYWNDFINDEFSNLKFSPEMQNAHFHCCVFGENNDLDNDEFLSDFVKKLPFYTKDVNQNSIHFWLLTPEILLTQNITQNDNYDKVVLALLDNFLQYLDEVRKQDKAEIINEIEKCFKNAKHIITKKGLLSIREEYKIKHEKEFKDKFWL